MNQASVEDTVWLLGLSTEEHRVQLEVNTECRLQFGCDTFQTKINGNIQIRKIGVNDKALEEGGIQSFLTEIMFLIKS